MNFTSLDYFIALVQEKSYTKAAQRLHVTQQTLSAHIAALEKEMNCKLVIRQIPLDFTWAGRVFYRHALSLRTGKDTMEKEIADAAGDETGIFRLGISPNRGHMILPDILSLYAKTYPGIHVELTEEVNRVLMKKLLDGDIDLTIAYFKEDVPGVTQEFFYKEEIVLLLPKVLWAARGNEEIEKRLESRSEGCLAPLGDFPFLLTGSGTVPGRMARRLFAEADINPPVIVSSDNLELLIELCVKGTGALFCPEKQVLKNVGPEDLKKIYIIHLKDAYRTISFGYRKDLRTWKPLSNFIALAQEERRRIEESRIGK